jgi:drug/metabolite transporter (DMT)-like permease
MGRTVLVLTLGILCLSTASVLIKFCDDVPAVTIAAYRMAMATVIMALLAAWKQVSIRGLGRRAWLGALLGSVFLALHFAFWVTSLKYTSVASSVVLVTTNPIFVGIFSWILFRERQPLALLAGIALSFAGSVVLALGDGGLDQLLAGGSSAVLGDALALLGAVMASGYLMTGSRMRERMDLLAYATLVYGFSAVWLWIMVLAMGLPVSGFKGSSHLSLVAMAVLPQAIGHTTINWALKHLKTGMVAVTILGEPIGASILAFFLLKESLSGTQFIGMALIFAAIIMASRKGAKEEDVVRSS